METGKMASKLVWIKSNECLQFVRFNNTVNYSRVIILISLFFSWHNLPLDFLGVQSTKIKDSLDSLNGHVATTIPTTKGRRSGSLLLRTNNQYQPFEDILVYSNPPAKRDQLELGQRLAPMECDWVQRPNLKVEGSLSVCGIPRISEGISRNPGLDAPTSTATIAQTWKWQLRDKREEEKNETHVDLEKLPICSGFCSTMEFFLCDICTALSECLNVQRETTTNRSHDDDVGGDENDHHDRVWFPWESANATVASRSKWLVGLGSLCQTWIGCCQ